MSARSSVCRSRSRSRRRPAAARGWTVLGEYIYRDQNGERYLKVRKCRDGTGKKQFPQYHWDGNGWAKGKPMARRFRIACRN